MGLILSLLANITAMLAGVTKTLSRLALVEDRLGNIESRLLQIQTELSEIKEITVAIGPQTTAALEQLGTAISDEVAQFAEYAISVTGADAEVAAAIRAKSDAVKAIIPDVLNSGELPGGDTSTTDESVFDTDDGQTTDDGSGA